MKILFPIVFATTCLLSMASKSFGEEMLSVDSGCALNIDLPLLEDGVEYDLYWTGVCEGGRAEGYGIATIIPGEANGNYDEVLAKLHVGAVNGYLSGQVYAYLPRLSTVSTLFLNEAGQIDGDWTTQFRIGTKDEFIRSVAYDAESGGKNTSFEGLRSNADTAFEYIDLSNAIHNSSFYAREFESGSTQENQCMQLQMLARDEHHWQYGFPANTVARASDCFVELEQIDQALELLTWAETSLAEQTPFDIARISAARAFVVSYRADNVTETEALDRAIVAFQVAQASPVPCEFSGELSKICNYVPRPIPDWVVDQFGIGNQKNTTISTYIVADLDSNVPLQEIFGLALSGNTDAMVQLATIEREAIIDRNEARDANKDSPVLPETEWVRFWERQALLRGSTHSHLERGIFNYKDISHLNDLVPPISLISARNAFLQQGEGSSETVRQAIAFDDADRSEHVSLAQEGNFRAQDAVVNAVRLEEIRGNSVERGVQWYFENTNYLEAYDIAIQCLSGLAGFQEPYCSDFSPHIETARAAISGYADIVIARDNVLRPFDGYQLVKSSLEQRWMRDIFSFLAQQNRIDEALSWGLMINDDFAHELDQIELFHHQFPIDPSLLLFLYDPLYNDGSIERFRSALIEISGQSLRLQGEEINENSVDQKRRTLLRRYLRMVHYTSHWAGNTSFLPEDLGLAFESEIQKTNGLFARNFPFVFGGTHPEFSTAYPRNRQVAVEVSEQLLKGALPSITVPSTVTGDEGEVIDGLLVLLEKLLATLNELGQIWLDEAVQTFESPKNQGISEIERLWESAFLNIIFEYDLRLRQSLERQSVLVAIDEVSKDFGLQHGLFKPWPFEVALTRSERLIERALIAGSIDAQIYYGRLYNSDLELSVSVPSSDYFAIVRNFTDDDIIHPKRDAVATFYELDWPRHW